ncbi:MAG: tRNA pseudouridine(55) synthase TruB [Hyphomicrobiaceae bacterium]
MARRKKGNRVNGWLIFDKPLEMTSTQAVGKVRWLFEAQKAGHAGTLDPLATGILPIALGEATKTVSSAVDGEKSYRFTVRWGVETTTDDTEGSATETSDARPTMTAIEALLPSFTGEIMQRPPAFSAIKIDGQRAYDLARDGEEVILEARPVVIDTLRIVEMPDDATTVFEATCGKGTYVRAIARDLGRALGCFGHVIKLRRTRVGPFGEDQAITLAELEELAKQDDGGIELMRCLMPIETALTGMVELQVSSNDAGRLRLGQPVLIRGRDAPIMQGEVYAVCKGQLVAMGEIERGELRPTRVFNLE